MNKFFVYIQKSLVQYSEENTSTFRDSVKSPEKVNLKKKKTVLVSSDLAEIQIGFSKTNQTPDLISVPSSTGN